MEYPPLKGWGYLILFIGRGFNPFPIILETAVESGNKAQSFEPQSFAVGVAFTFWECSTPTANNSDSKSCTFFLGSTAVSRFNGLEYGP